MFFNFPIILIVKTITMTIIVNMNKIVLIGLWVQCCCAMNFKKKKRIICRGRQWCSSDFWIIIILKFLPLIKCLHISSGSFLVAFVLSTETTTTTIPYVHRIVFHFNWLTDSSVAMVLFFFMCLVRGDHERELSYAAFKPRFK